ncbi:DNA primase [Modestobacter sp. VKM Ac-2979]|uniref:DNA primase n=1 Tax=unclassified Modestobacter TaxID=2643866 RepID=UPI0022AB9A77|nr:MULTISPECIES: DNA primase [unclassified Modestobacter]MCZ2813177.1 DNA primase [Modestobacter sp. VKM Ac-2979]MCZ2842794.1 DNA primase [Modestobacter sp. VKM Ac-2980]
MAGRGRIRAADIALVRERTKIDDIIGEHLQLKRAGGGSLKGLCPFHDEKSPSFQVTPSRGLYHCLAGETGVLTEDGTVPIRELAGKTVRVLNGDGGWVEAPFRSYGIQRLMRLTLSRNGRTKIVHATDEHRWFVPSGALRQERREKLTKDLKPGDRLSNSFAEASELAAVGAVASGSQATGSPRTSGGPGQPNWVVQSVEWSDRVEEVFCAEVPGTHAFTLEDNLLTGNCFGCGVGGDVIRFVQEIDHLSFSEAVELLAGRAGVQLQYEDDGGRATAGPDRAHAGQRARLVAANAAAAEFYASQLMTPEAAPARSFLADRGFDRQVALDFNCGYAPGGWDTLTRHLRGLGYTQSELVTGGLAKESSRGTLIDRFHRRLLWPIRDLTGDVIGFGARKLMDDDPGPKYLNTPETPLYKKSSVLYGVERAKRDIARNHQAVVVEGYTDVMACHVAGVTTAVASCGTAFGPEHINVLRRLLMDQDEFRGEVVYTFDGDAAGQAAAMKSFKEDQRFVAQTFVAVEQEGRDPCELRQAHGDAAVRDLIGRRTPLIEFVLRTHLAEYDLDTVEGRVAALDKTAPLLAQIKDHALRPAYARRLAGLLGLPDETEVVARVRQLAGENGGERPRSRPRTPQRTPDDAAIEVEREAVKAALQCPEIAGPQFDAVEPSSYTHPDYAAVAAAVSAAGGAAGATTTGAAWLEEVTAHCDRDTAKAMLTALAVEPLHAVGENDPTYVNALMARLHEMATVREIAALKGKLQRTNPIEAQDEYMRAFKKLMDLEQLAISLRKRASGGLTP